MYIHSKSQSASPKVTLQFSIHVYALWPSAMGCHTYICIFMLRPVISQ